MTKTKGPNTVAVEVEPAYECGECGATWVKSDAEGQANKCPDCGKMGSKLTDHAFKCPGCDAIIDMDTGAMLQ